MLTATLVIAAAITTLFHKAVGFTVNATRHFHGESAVRVICSANTIGLLVENMSVLRVGDLSVQRIFSSRHQCDPACVYSVIEPATVLRFELPYDTAECGVVSRRLTHPAPGLEHSLKLIISYSPIELTEDDRVFALKCRYFIKRNITGDAHELDLLEETNLSSSSPQLPTQKKPMKKSNILDANSNLTAVTPNLVQHKPLSTTLPSKFQTLMEISTSSKLSVQRDDVERAPHCEYTLHLDSLNGPIAEFATLGQKIFHRWQCDGSIFALKVYKCTVHDGDGQRYSLIDKNGCSTDIGILPRVFYTDDLGLAYASSTVFRFSNTSRVFFNCLMYICPKRDPECQKAVLPHCDNHQQSHRVKRGFIWREKTAPSNDRAYLNVQSTHVVAPNGGAVVSYDIRPATESFAREDKDEDNRDAALLTHLTDEMLPPAGNAFTGDTEQDLPQNDVYLVSGGRTTTNSGEIANKMPPKHKIMGTTNSIKRFNHVESSILSLKLDSQENFVNPPSSDVKSSNPTSPPLTGPSFLPMIFSPWSVRVKKVDHQNLYMQENQNNLSSIISLLNESRTNSNSKLEELTSYSTEKASNSTLGETHFSTTTLSTTLTVTSTKAKISNVADSDNFTTAIIDDTTVSFLSRSKDSNSSPVDSKDNLFVWPEPRIRVRPSLHPKLPEISATTDEISPSDSTSNHIIDDVTTSIAPKRSTDMLQEHSDLLSDQKIDLMNDGRSVERNIEESLAKLKDQSDVVDRKQRLEEILLLQAATDTIGCGVVREEQARQLSGLRRTVVVLSAACSIAVFIALGAIGIAFRRRLRARFALHDVIRLD